MQNTLSTNITSAGLHNVQYSVNGQEDGQGYISSEPTTGSIGLVMIQEWWGMNKSITITADKFAQASGFVVLTPDLYRGKVATNHEEAGHYFGDLDWPNSVGNILGAVKYLKSKGCTKVGVTGFCMGGALSIVSASSSTDIDAVVAFYGVPDLTKCDVSKIKCPIIAHFGEKDKAKGFSDQSARENLEKAFKNGGVANYETKVWANADHAFMNQDSPNYNADVAKEAYEHVIAWLKKYLK